MLGLLTPALAPPPTSTVATSSTISGDARFEVDEPSLPQVPPPLPSLAPPAESPPPRPLEPQ